MHQAHTLGLAPGRFHLLNVPPSDGAPAPVAEALDAYRELADQLRVARTRHNDLQGRVLEREAEALDARALADGAKPTHRAALDTNRENARRTVAGLEVRLDDTLRRLIAAVDDHGEEWSHGLDAECGEITARIEAALAVVETGGRRLDEVRRLSRWLATFPERTKWAGDIASIPDDLATPLSTLARYLRGELTVEQIGITSFPGQQSAMDLAGADGRRAGSDAA